MARWFATIAWLVGLGAALGSLSACGSQGTVSVVRTGWAGAVGLRSVVDPHLGGLLEGSSALHRTVDAPGGAESVLTLKAAVPGADWGVRGREAVTVRVSIDGIHNQDIVLYAGDRAHEYISLLGRLPAGRHRLTVTRLASHSAPGLERVEVASVHVSHSLPGDAEYEVLTRAPIIWGRPGSHVTDTPLLMMVDDRQGPSGARRLRYTMVFSNEDGGTETPALLARWGRTTDIDWCYDVERDGAGKVLKETYQGAWHWTHDFEGQREDAHPLLRVSTDNNCYSDQGVGPLKFRPFPAFTHNPAATAREEVLDRHPWTYGIAARELFREGKAVRDTLAASERVLQGAPKVVGDPRRFLVVEFAQQHEGRGVAARVFLRGDARPYVSNRGDDGLQASRSGWCRVAVELPRRVTLGDIARLELVGKGRGSSRITGVRRVLAFDDGFNPVVLPIDWAGEGWLRSEADRVTVYDNGAASVSPAGP